jgi:hypothetical protein
MKALCIWHRLLAVRFHHLIHPLPTHSCAQPVIPPRKPPVQALHSHLPAKLRYSARPILSTIPNPPGSRNLEGCVMGAGFSCFQGRTATRRNDSNDSEEDVFDPRKKGYNPYAVEIAKMGDAHHPAPKSNILLPLYVYPNPEAWTPLQQT